MTFGYGEGDLSQPAHQPFDEEITESSQQRSVVFPRRLYSALYQTASSKR